MIDQVLRGKVALVAGATLGVMFFPEKSKAYSEARRVLRSGGVFIFNVWDRIKENEFADTVTTALESVFQKSHPVSFRARRTDITTIKPSSEI